MLMSLAASLILILGLIHPVSMSFSALPEDSEGSGYDLAGSGSGDGTDSTFQSSSVPSSDSNDWPTTDSESVFVVMANSKKFMERNEVIAALIAGGVIGLLLAASLAVILVYKWKKENDGGYILGQQRDEDYHKPNREVEVV
ncbi:uncharacterized protein V6R79_023066 [Siganus canaliculatus]